MRKFFFYIFILTFFIIKVESNTALVDNNNFIAHAGGGIDNIKYTNSLEALSESIDQGFKYIELDINISKDNKLVFLHDWISFKKSIDFKNQNNNPLLYSEYLEAKIHNKYNVITLEKLNNFFFKNTELFLVTDKINNFEILTKNIKFMDRTIVEIFGKQNYLKSFFYNIPNKMLSTNLNFYDKIFIKLARVKYIAIHTSVVEKNRSYLENLVKNNINVFAFSSNNKKFMINNLNKTVSAIYTDFWDLKNGKCTFNCVTY